MSIWNQSEAWTWRVHAHVAVGYSVVGCLAVPSPLSWAIVDDVVVVAPDGATVCPTRFESNLANHNVMRLLFTKFLFFFGVLMLMPHHTSHIVTHFCIWPRSVNKLHGWPFVVHLTESSSPASVLHRSMLKLSWWAVSFALLVRGMADIQMLCFQWSRSSATRDYGCLLVINISAGDEVSSFPSINWLTEVWRCPCWLTVKLPASDVQHICVNFSRTWMSSPVRRSSVWNVRAPYSGD